MRCSHSDPGYSHPYCPIHIHVHSSHPICERPTCLISDPARSDLRQTQQHKTRLWSCLADECTQEKYSDSHYHIMCIVREHKHCPRTSVPYSQKVWSFLKTLYLSLRNSCNNELNQTSDAAEDHDHGYELFATELPNLFVFFYLTLLVLSEHRLFSTQADSSAHKKRANFHSSSLTSLTSTHYPFLTSSPSFCRLNLSYIRHQKSSPASVLLTTHLFGCQPELSLSDLFFSIARMPSYQSGSIPLLQRLAFLFTLPNRHPS
jgi:hypothetical protein